MSPTVSSASSLQHFWDPCIFLSPDQQSGIHCLIICAIQQLTPNNLGGTWRRICSPDIRSVSALEVLRNHALQIDIYLLTYTYRRGGRNSVPFVPRGKRLRPIPDFWRALSLPNEWMKCIDFENQEPAESTMPDESEILLCIVTGVSCVTAERRRRRWHVTTRRYTDDAFAQHLTFDGDLVVSTDLRRIQLMSNTWAALVLVQRRQRSYNAILVCTKRPNY